MSESNMNSHNGYKAWLAYDQQIWKKPDLKGIFFDSICVEPMQQELEIPARELKEALTAIFGKTPEMVRKPSSDSTVLIHLVPHGKAPQTADRANEPEHDGYVSDSEASRLGSEGFLIKRYRSGDADLTVIAAKTGAGALYGVFALIRQILCGKFSKDTYMLQNPAVRLRMLNQWDNMDGSIERGYAGKSIFYKDGQIVRDLERVEDYARLMASVGLNGIVLNNVNVHWHETRLITRDQLPNVARIADVFRKYGIKIFLSINFSSPIELGGLDTADPLDSSVQAWWREKTAEIYEYIPDFGGFHISQPFFRAKIGRAHV